MQLYSLFIKCVSRTQVFLILINDKIWKLNKNEWKVQINRQQIASFHSKVKNNITLK